MSEVEIEVRVLDLPGASGGCACSDMSLSPEYAPMIRQKVAELKTAIAEAYGTKVSVEFIDLRENPEEKAGELGQLLVSKQYPTPLIVIAGEPKFAGSILVKKIVREIGTLINV